VANERASVPEKGGKMAGDKFASHPWQKICLAFCGPFC
jgi:hypothetical protein